MCVAEISWTQCQLIIAFKIDVMNYFTKYTIRENHDCSFRALHLGSLIFILSLPTYVGSIAITILVFKTGCDEWQADLTENTAHLDGSDL